MSTPLLSLVMIVKDEATSLRRTLESVRGAADRALILDTGSTDGTQALARQLFVEVLPGELHEEPFVDFATTRNRSLELCAGQSVFALILSGDETLQRELAPYRESKGTLRFPLNEQLPVDRIQRAVKARLDEITATR